MKPLTRTSIRAGEGNRTRGLGELTEVKYIGCNGSADRQSIGPAN
jgi:hypothetical protein